MSRKGKSTTQRDTSLDIAAIVAYMRTITYEHMNGYNALDTEGLARAAYKEIECRNLSGSVPAAYQLAIRVVEHEYKQSRGI